MTPAQKANIVSWICVVLSCFLAVLLLVWAAFSYERFERFVLPTGILLILILRFDQ